MTTLLLSAALLLSPPQADPLPAPRPLYTHVQRGFFSQYNRQPTLDTASYRMRMGEIPRRYYDGYVALASCEHLGETVQASLEGSPRTYTLIVFDCSHSTGTTAWLQENQIIGELGWFVARRANVPVGRGVAGRMATPWETGQQEVTAQ